MVLDYFHRDAGEHPLPARVRPLVPGRVLFSACRAQLAGVHAAFFSSVVHMQVKEQDTEMNRKQFALVMYFYPKKARKTKLYVHPLSSLLVVF